MKVGAALRSIRRRLFGAPKRQRPYDKPDAWWDQRYERMDPYTVAGHMELTEEQNEAEHEMRWALLRDAVQRYRQPGQDRLLDAGCGNGLLSLRFVELGFEVTGIDFSPTAIEQAREAGGAAATFVVAGIDAYSPDEPFDVIVSNSVLMMITDDAVFHRGVTNLAALLAPGGHLVFEEFLLPRGERTPTESRGVLRRRALEDYLDVIAPTAAELVEEVPFVTPHGGQSKQILVFGRPGGGVGG